MQSVVRRHPERFKQLTTYDSAFEQRIAEQMQSLGFTRCDDFYSVTFSDKKGQTFHAKADWYHPGLKLYAETKSHTLNSKKSQQSAEKGVERQRQYRQIKGQPLKLIDLLENQWCHSKHKQAAVQRSLSPQQMIVVFEQSIPIDEMQAYKKAGLVCISLADLHTYKAYLHFGSKKLFLQFNYEYYAENVSFVL
jgi:hypothetical protein